MPSLHYKLRIHDGDPDTLVAFRAGTGGNRFVISTIPSDDNPYIASPPHGDGESLNPATGQVSVGAYTVRVIDAAQIITSNLADAQGRQQNLSAAAVIEESTDDGATWTLLTGAYVNRVALVDALVYEFTIGESRRVEQTAKVFERVEDGFDRVSLIIGGPIIGDFGPYPDLGRPRFQVTSVENSSVGQLVVLRWTGGALNVALEVTQISGMRDNVRDYINEVASHYISPGPGAEGLNFFSGLTARLMAIDTPPGLTSNPPDGFDAVTQDFTPVGILGNVDATRWILLGSEMTIALSWPTSSPVPAPAVGDRFKLVVFPREISARNPLHWIGHPVDLAAQLLSLRGETVNVPSIGTAKHALGESLQIEIRITAAMTVATALETLLYGPFGFAHRWNTSGEREFFATRKRLAAAPVSTLTNDDLSSDEGTVWMVEEGSAVSQITFKTHEFHQLGPPFTSDPIGHTDDAIDFLAEQSVSVVATPPDGSPAIFGAQTLEYELAGHIVGYWSSGSSDPATWGPLDWYVDAIGQDLFDFQGRGAITMELSVLRGITTAQVGDELVVDIPHLPGEA